MSAQTYVFISPEGNPEVWTEKPQGYFTEEEWAVGHPAPQPEPPTLAEARNAAVLAIKDKSWRVETGGMLIQGMPIPTDRESQAMITGAVVGSLLNPDAITRWQTGAVSAEGAPVFVDLSAAQIRGIGLAVRAHVQACFDARDAKCAAVAGLGGVEEVKAWLAEHLETGWPGGDAGAVPDTGGA